MDFQSICDLCLDEDIHIIPLGQDKYKMLMYLSVMDRWNDVSVVATASYINDHLRQHGYMLLQRDALFSGSWDYRLAKPDWPVLKEWLRVIYNERERKTEYGSIEEKVYQTIISLLLDDPPQEWEDVHSEAWYELERTKSSTATRLWEEFLDALEGK